MFPDCSVEVPDAFTCPISSTLMLDPVFNCIGHSYDRAFIEEWFRDHQTDPYTNEQLSNRNLTPNWNLKQQIEAYRSTLSKDDKNHLNATRETAYDKLDSVCGKKLQIMSDKIDKISCRIL